MTKVKVEKYGQWKSDITLDDVASKQDHLNSAVLDAVTGQLFWDVQKPSGSTVILSRQDGIDVEWTPDGFSAVSMVHEYGGGAYFAHDGTVYFVNKSDQVLYKQDSPKAKPVAITEDLGDSNLRYAIGHLNKTFNKIIVVREDHRKADKEHYCINTIVAIDPTTGEQNILIEGADFYRSMKSCGNRLIYVSWDMPNMPWDTTSLSEAELVMKDGKLVAENIKVLQTGNSILQASIPLKDSYLYLSDKNGYYNVWKSGNDDKPHFHVKQESGSPYGWDFGMPGYAYVKSKNQIVIGAKKKLLLVDYSAPQTRDRNLAKICKQQNYRFKVFANILCHGNVVYFIGLGDTGHLPTLAKIDLNTNLMTVYNDSTPDESISRYISAVQDVSFDTGDGKAYGFYYPPCNPDFEGETGTKPPLLMKVHGGPTGMAEPSLDLKIRYFTSRGFAVFDLDYRGSSGYGRDFRRKLYKMWGVYDLDDAVNAANYLVNEGLVDPEMLAVSGGSSGGYTTMAVLVFRNTFKAGVSYYGISDLKLLAQDTHKFEARYLDQMVGKLPEDEAIYNERSPYEHVDKITGALGFLQGSDDKVVPPPQSRSMHGEVKTKGLPTYYIEFEGEGHGFVKEDSVKRAIYSEILFYSKVFGFVLADEPAYDIDFDNI